MEGIRSIYGIASARSMGILTVIRQYGHQNHAYEGVGFEVLFVGTYDKCAEYAKSSAKKVCADFKDGEYTEYYDQVVVDTGIE